MIIGFCLVVMAAVIIFESAIIVYDKAVYLRMRRRLMEQHRRMDEAVEKAVKEEMERRRTETKIKELPFIDVNMKEVIPDKGEKL